MTTAGVNTVDASNDGTIPGWAKHYFEQQTKLMERLLEATTAPKAPRSRATRASSVGNKVTTNENADLRNTTTKPTNLKGVRETPTGRSLSEHDSARAVQSKEHIATKSTKIHIKRGDGECNIYQV